MRRRQPARDELTGDLFEVPQPAAPDPASQDYRAEVSAKLERAKEDAQRQIRELKKVMGEDAGAGHER